MVICVTGIIVVFELTGIIVVFELTGIIVVFELTGIIVVLPCLDKWTKVDLRMKAFSVPPQLVGFVNIILLFCIILVNI